MDSPETQSSNNRPPRPPRDNFRVLPGGEDPGRRGRDMPASDEAEQHVLACCLLDNEVIGRCLEAGLTAGAFYWPANAILFKVIRELSKNPPVNLEVLAEELATQRLLEQVGGFPYLMQVTGKIPTTAHAGYFIEKVREKWLLRELIKRCTGAVEGAYGFAGGLGEFMAGVDNDVRRLTQFVAGLDKESMKSRAAAASAAARAAMAGRVDKSRYLFTGLPRLDQALGAFDVKNEDWFIVIAAEPSGGKSSFGRQVAVHNLRAKHEAGGKKRGAVFLLETGLRGWMQRAAGVIAKVNVRNLDTLPKDHAARYESALKEVEGWVGETLWIYDDVTTIDEIEVRVMDHSRALREKDRAAGIAPELCRGLDFVVVDYLQLVGTRKKCRTREEEVSDVGGRMKKLLKHPEVDTTGFVLVQINREARKENRRPKLTDLRESGSIEQNADGALVLHRLAEDKTGAAQDEKATLLLLELLQLKRRNGPTGYEEIEFNKELTRFEDAPHKGDPRPGDAKGSNGFGRESS